LFAAATVMRPATNEFPKAEPAITRQIRAVAKYATPLPRKCVMAVWVRSAIELTVTKIPITYDCSGIRCRHDFPGQENVVDGVCGNVAQDNGGDRGVDRQRKLPAWVAKLCSHVVCLVVG
jgi:hypothetical protein